MDLKSFLFNEIAKSKYIEKFYIFDTIKINWLLKDDSNKDEAQKFIDEIQKKVKQFLPNLIIESTIVDNAEIETVKEITHGQECTSE